LGYKKKKKRTLEPKQRVAVVWAHIPCKMVRLQPLVGLAGVGVVTAGGDRVVVVVEVASSPMVMATAKDQTSKRSLKER
jgi:hypothetical protein